MKCRYVFGLELREFLKKKNGTNKTFLLHFVVLDVNLKREFIKKRDALESLQYFGLIKEKRHLIAEIKFGK